MSGDQASTTTQFELGESWLAAARVTLIRDGDGWEEIAPTIPEGTPTIDMDLVEFAFLFDPAQLAAGEVAFVVGIVGEQEHEAALYRIAEGVILEETLGAKTLPRGSSS